MNIKELNTTDVNGQGSLDWKRARLGMFTATRIAPLMSAGRKKDEVFGQTAITEIADVAGERLLDPDMIADDAQFQEWGQLQCRENAAMRHGHDNEDYARIQYEMDYNANVLQVGMCTHPEIPTLAASPDGLIVDVKGEIIGAVEIKCPSTNKTYMRYKWNIHDGESLKAEKPEYYWQIQNVMNVTGAKWTDFIVYSPFHTDTMHVVRIERNEEDIAKINERVNLAEEYIKTMNND